MKKIFLVISAIFSISILTPLVNASENSKIKVDEVPIEHIQILWESLKEDAVTVDESGHLILNNYHGEFSLQPGYSTLLESIGIWNEAIDCGILQVDTATLEMSNTDTIFDDEQLPEEILANLKIYENTDLAIVSVGADSDVYRYDARPYAAHNCTYPTIYLSSMCEQNYQTIVKFYNSMVLAQQLNPGNALNPALSTVSYWVGFVREGGQWDYKLEENLGPWDKTYCFYFNNTYQHITAEYIGNYNYGYTGSFLFPLSVLHGGSYIVSGFDPADQYTDWPSIDAGYYAKTGQ